MRTNDLENEAKSGIDWHIAGFGGPEEWQALARQAAGIEPERIKAGLGVAPDLFISAREREKGGAGSDPHLCVSLADGGAAGAHLLDLRFHACGAAGRLDGEIERYRMEVYRLLRSFGVLPHAFGAGPFDLYRARTADPARDVLGLCRAIVAKIRPIVAPFEPVEIRRFEDEPPRLDVTGADQE
jgi:hypothetical protein